jgi:hypothetical protein
VCKDMLKKVKQSNITSLFPEYSIFSSPIQPISFDYPDNFQLAAPISFQSTPIQMFSCSLLINVHTTMFSVLGYLRLFFKFSLNFAHLVWPCTGFYKSIPPQPTCVCCIAQLKQVYTSHNNILPIPKFWKN